MKIIKPSIEIINLPPQEEVLAHIEKCGRTCYKSEGKIADGSAEKFVRGIIKRGHESVLEHVSFTVRFICDRGVTHEIVRHRLASYSQESTRYCRYSDDGFGNEITVIEPLFLDRDTFLWHIWETACKQAEESYMQMLHYGAKPEEARSVLPNSLKTEICMTANLREFRHFLKLRTAAAAHPQIREVAMMLLNTLHERLPVLFDDIWENAEHG